MLARRSALLALVIVLAGCAAPPSSAPPPLASAASVPDPEIQAVLDQASAAWARGDLEGFMDVYARSPELSFVAGTTRVLRGWQEVHDTYQRAYFASGTPAQLVRWDTLQVRRLTPDLALAFGRYFVEDAATRERKRTGMTSLVLVRTPEGWRIIHDQSAG